MKPVLFLLAAAALAPLAACIAPAPVEPTCAALPSLPAGATPVQRQQHHEGVIALYAECARSRQ
ncbi:hypothetical protein SAMN05216567_10140 [Variovorax sp. OK605]|uniref:hypothetical protein n=1 Tax=Variovorax sp. OK605 TaxID=1855317 RepID=UPI0008E4E38A|nr:hypothetical protein [Variovorax sp. OK605]SFO51664.1 hypothetical protein SAMN05216567_10140 [Variovorax sp. OK605]